MHEGLFRIAGLEGTSTRESAATRERCFNALCEELSTRCELIAHLY